MPMGIIEAMGFGLPCIVTEGTNFSNFISENDCGFACSYETDDIFNKIKRIINDIDKRNKMSLNAEMFVKRQYDMNKIINNLLNEYKKL